jgi:predicted ester cyclase
MFAAIRLVCERGCAVRRIDNVRRRSDAREQEHGSALVQGILGESLEPKNRKRTCNGRHYPMHEPKKGRAAVLKFMTEFRDAFPDLNFRGVGGLIAEGDFVVGRWEGGGTHTGQAFSDFRIGSIPAASGRKMKFAGTTVLRLENGRIAEELGQEDALSAMLQLGLIRLPELEMVQERPGGPLPSGWTNMSRPPETGR